MKPSSLEILDRITEIIPPKIEADVAAAPVASAKQSDGKRMLPPGKSGSWLVMRYLEHSSAARADAMGE